MFQKGRWVILNCCFEFVTKNPKHVFGGPIDLYPGLFFENLFLYYMKVSRSCRWKNRHQFYKNLQKRTRGNILTLHKNKIKNILTKNIFFWSAICQWTHQRPRSNQDSVASLFVCKSNKLFRRKSVVADRQYALAPQWRKQFFTDGVIAWHDEYYFWSTWEWSKSFKNEIRSAICYLV